MKKLIVCCFLIFSANIYAGDLEKDINYTRDFILESQLLLKGIQSKTPENNEAIEDQKKSISKIKFFLLSLKIKKIVKEMNTSFEEDKVSCFGKLSNDLISEEKTYPAFKRYDNCLKEEG